MRIPLLALVAAALVLTGCGAKTGAPADHAPEALQGKTFVAQSITKSGEAMGIVTGTKVQLQFTDDDRLVATAGCNIMSGPVTLTDNRLDADLGTTEMACDDPLQAQDDWLSDVLGQRPSWRLDGENLVVNADETELVLAPQTTAPLEGTKWTVTTLITGDVAGAATTPATFEFADGTVTVTGLCNLQKVTYQEDGTSMTFELGPLTRKACAPEIMTVETAAVAVLDGPATYDIKGPTLTIKNGDHSLQLNAGGGR